MLANYYTIMFKMQAHWLIFLKIYHYSAEFKGYRMNFKYIFVLLLLVLNIGAMHMDPVKFKTAVDAAYEKLKSQNGQERSEALGFLWAYKKEEIGRTYVLLSQQDDLIFKGTLSSCMTEELHDCFKQGFFSFDNKCTYFPGKSFLIIGREIIPTMHDYARMLIPADKLNSVTNHETANCFKIAIAQAEKKAGLK